MMTLEPRSGDTYVGRSPGYPWDGVYGGQLAAQSLLAASATLGRPLRVHSLHGYFVRRGAVDEPISFDVERARDGRSFATRTVVARQSDRTIFTLGASFHDDEPSADLQTASFPNVAAPEALPSGSWSEMFDRRFAPTDGEAGRAFAWMRMTDQVADDPMLQACALAYLVDDIPGDGALALLHPERPPAEDLESVDWSIFNHSLDYCLWLHRPVRATEWHLVDVLCQSMSDACAMVLGRVFDRAGTHVATVAQEVLLRPARGGAAQDASLHAGAADEVG